MGRSRQRQARRQKQAVDRRRSARDDAARETQRLQQAAEFRRDFKRRQRRHTVAFVIWGLAAIVAIGHFFEHAGTVQIVSASFQDLAIGWPMAGLLAVVGGVIYGT
jgi:hypothetical protein